MKKFFKITVVSLLTAASFVLSYGATHQTSSGIFPPSPGQNKTTYIDNHSALVRSGYHSCAVLQNYGLNINASFSSQNCVISLA